MLSFFGYEIVRSENIKKLKSRLSHASGALSDIQHLVTSCVDKNANEHTKEIASAVLSRILCSADRVRNKPSWYIHDYERELFEKYLNGETKACASNNSCIEEARELNAKG